MNPHKVVSREEWLEARKRLLSQERRELPWVQVDKAYVFIRDRLQLRLFRLVQARRHRREEEGLQLRDPRVPGPRAQGTRRARPPGSECLGPAPGRVRVRRRTAEGSQGAGGVAGAAWSRAAAALAPASTVSTRALSRGSSQSS